ncbi:N-acetyltransferase [Kineobactrum sediminis]|uniref:N-acetyltransferase n=1 Tax=Kineobactrum sediminis TaxID=1905677 RepID=A0A2N5Y5S1_9GAMM|nr:GNAT family N-acetyltransferase [Kineobactrum sediminis]PLW83722.1 N-acetyltransferase [Kineobactrum sediminis]
MLKGCGAGVPVIFNLASYPQAIDELAGHHYREWEYLYPDDTIASFAADLSRPPGADTLPTTWVLTADKQVMGSVSLLEHDLDTDSHWSPWLANLWVHQDWRGRGLGKRLVLHACEQGVAAGFTTLYLYTAEHAAFYAGMGWQQLRSTHKNGVPITIMSFALTRAA